MQPLIFWLALYTSLEHDKRDQIQEYLGAIPAEQDLAALAEALRECEAQFLATQRRVLEHIRPALAADARALISTPMLEAFVETLTLELREQHQGQPLRIDANPDWWYLATLNTPLHLNVLDVQPRLDPSAPHGADLVVPMHLQLSAWQHALDVHTARVSGCETDPGKQFYSRQSIAQRWLDVCRHLEVVETDRHVQPLCAAVPATINQTQVIEELACLLVYVSEVFNLFSVQEHVTPLLLGATHTAISFYEEHFGDDTP